LTHKFGDPIIYLSLLFCVLDRTCMLAWACCLFSRSLRILFYYKKITHHQ